MAKTKTAFICTECAHQAPKWIGQCPDCDEWNTHEEAVLESIAPPPVPLTERPRLIADVTADNWAATPTRISELDRVLGGGFVTGSVALFGGEPGIGKSTLLLQAMAALSRNGHRCLYVSAEESSEQVRIRADRLDTI